MWNSLLRLIRFQSLACLQWPHLHGVECGGRRLRSRPTAALRGPHLQKRGGNRADGRAAGLGTAGASGPREFAAPSETKLRRQRGGFQRRPVWDQHVMCVVFFMWHSSLLQLDSQAFGSFFIFLWTCSSGMCDNGHTIFLSTFLLYLFRFVFFKSDFLYALMCSLISNYFISKTKKPFKLCEPGVFDQWCWLKVFNGCWEKCTIFILVIIFYYYCFRVLPFKIPSDLMFQTL